MRVLLISHTCQSASEGQPRAYQLGSHPDVDLLVVVPHRWKHYGIWREPEMPLAPQPFEFTRERVAIPWLGPAQNYLHFYPHLASVIRGFEPDIIDVWEEPWAAISAQVCLLRKRISPSTKVVCETEQNISKKLPPPFEQFRKYVLHRADHAVGRSTQAIEVLRSKGFQGPATLVPNGVDADQFRPMDRSVCRDALGLNGFVVGYVGRMVEEKGLADLLDAFAKCKGQPNLLLIGSGPMEQQLRNRIAACGIGDRVRMLPNQSSAHLPALMNAMDCLVLPSRTTESWKEQFGRVIIEAAACSTPVIGSNSGAIPYVIGAGGMIFPERNVDELSVALERIQNNPVFARELGMAGRAQVELQYSWKRVAEKLVDIYEQTLSAPISVRSVSETHSANTDANNPAVQIRLTQ